MAEYMENESCIRIGNESLFMIDEAKEADIDVALMRLVGQDDVDAYRRLVNRHLNRALSFVERMIGDRNDSEDIAQEAFLKVWKEAGRWEAKAKFTTWFHRVLYNLCIDHLRKLQPLTADMEIENFVSEVSDPEESFISREVADQVKEALQKLPQRQRAALILFYYEELNQNEAAEVLEVSVTALESLLFRARTTLRKILKREDLKNVSVEA